MMRNKWLLSFMLTLACTTIYAQQNTSTVRGRVLDADDSPVMCACEEDQRFGGRY